MTQSNWEQQVKILLDSPLQMLLQQDPFTNRSFLKPRGYAGDAELIDYIYSPTSIPPGTSDLGELIWQHSISTPEPVGVRERKEIIKQEIRNFALQLPEPRVLSIACGHLREADELDEIREGFFNRKNSGFWALDSDLISLSVIEKNHKESGIKLLPMSIRAIISGHLKHLDRLDLIYSSGLYDYLDQRLSIRLTGKLFSMLRSGGKLLIANFAQDGASVGYMESFMAWNLIYRNEEEIDAWSQEIPIQEIANKKIWRGANRHVIYIELTKS